MIGRLRIKRDGKSRWPEGSFTHPFTLNPSKGRRVGTKASTSSARTEMVQPVAAMKRSGIAESLRHEPSIPLRCIEATLATFLVARASPLDPLVMIHDVIRRFVNAIP